MRETKAGYNFLYYLIFVLLGWAVRLLYPLRIFGRENLPRGAAPFVLAPNHLRAIDPMYVLLARGLGRKMLIMGKEELFSRSALLDFFWRVVGAFPIDRGAGNRGVLQRVCAEVQKGRGLLLFPEGTRSKTGQLGPLKSGAFVVAQQAGCDIVPCRISYSAGKPKPFKRITVIFGAPVPLEALGLTGEYSPQKLRGAKRQFTEILEELYARHADKL